ncbi:hypothetical protein [Rossellomorea aquimaris]|uniref:hypothetical protein n=1 Tax=Rossellomorea aquimaris TaxID=189382 RepID=UPI0007D05E8A|nr:hypothetical protein [Rossellomorea aquimaris]
MLTDFNRFFSGFQTAWKRSSIEEMEKLISKEYKAREVTGSSEIVDFGYEESLKGWEQGFEYVKKHQGEWVFLGEKIIPLRENEVMVVFWATIKIGEEMKDSGHLFFDSFKKETHSSKWKLIRSYIEAGIPPLDLTK